MTLGQFGGLLCSAPGTLAILVRSVAGDAMILSCSHVLAHAGQFGVPFDQVPDFRKVVQQPISPNCDPTENRLGVLQPGFSTIVPEAPGVSNAEDCALALLDPAVAAAASPIEPATGRRISSVAEEDPGTWREGMATVLLGAVHPGAGGSVVAFCGPKLQSIDFPGVGRAQFSGLVLYRTLCGEGDSGGAVLDEQDRLLGMHLAGNSSGTLGLFLPLAPYLKQHNLTLF